MPEPAKPEDVRSPAARLVADAAVALKARREEVDRLNVFPVPDGDTGTNMSLTMDSVIGELALLPADASASDICKSVTHGSLMGARGNSGVILSQVLRGLCESIDGTDEMTAQVVADALAGAERTAYQAVRKPVEGTMLTVVKDTARAARRAARQGATADEVLEVAVAEVYASVRRTPELLPVLKDAGVVDAGAFGLAILAEGFVSSMQGRELKAVDTTVEAKADIDARANDWDDTDHLYCTEFLVYGKDLDRDTIESWMAEQGGSQLVVGDPGLLKVHVHVDDPASVLAYATSLGEVAEVHINNMRKQSVARAEQLASEHGDVPSKAIGFVAVATGSGLERILASLGADEIVCGGQTMNPSTADLLAAVEKVDAAAVVVLPNNSNIVMTAQQVAGVASRPVAVVPTKSVPESFAALLAADPAASLEENAAAMTEAASLVRAGEVTWAVKDSRSSAGEIKAGDVIGIADHDIKVVGSDVLDVSARLVDALADASSETLTILAGEQFDDADLAMLAERVGKAHPGLEVEALRGDQPLYPVILSVE
jgi:DAK2 domain fusion protein YloV